LHPLTGSNDWVDLNGTVCVLKVWNGRAQLEEIEAEGSTGHFEGLTLFLYNPQAHQWGQYFADSSEGVLNQPGIGEFKDGRGEFLDQESFNGRTILVRFVWSDITPDFHRVEQSFSDDNGRTWEPNFVATLTGEEEKGHSDEASSFPASESHDGARDFDFNLGLWKTHIRRLEHPLTDSHTWATTTAHPWLVKFGAGGRVYSNSKLPDRQGRSKALGCGSTTRRRINGT
jgi:hypothetical protein